MVVTSPTCSDRATLAQVKDAPNRGRRAQLTAAAVALLETQGPDAMTARKVTAQVGTSRMAIYTDFGSMAGLIASVVDHGFGLLLGEFERQRFTGRHLVDIWAIAQAQRDFALAHRHLYAVMFAAETVGGHQRTGAELEQGIEALRFMHRHCRAAVADGDLVVDEPRTATRQLWVGIHGHLMLELAGYMNNEPDPVRSFAETVSTVMIGFGADPTPVRRAVERV